MPSPAAAGIVAATVYAYPDGLTNPRWSLPAIALVVVPAVLMVSTIRFRSFKSIDMQSRHPFRLLLFFALFIAALVTRPQKVLVVVAYTVSGLAAHRRDCSRVFGGNRPGGAGRVIVTVVPRPFTLVTAMVPPLSSTLRFAIVRPSPVPVAFVEK